MQSQIRSFRGDVRAIKRSRKKRASFPTDTRDRRNEMKYTMPIVVLTAFVTLCKAADATSANLRKIYESRVAQIEAIYSNATASALQEYGASITQAKERYRAQGDLDGLLGANKELARFVKEASCPNADPEGLPPLLTEARVVYRDTIASEVPKKTLALTQLAGAYVARLTAMEKQYVKQEEIKAAMGVRDESKRIDFILADLQSKAAPTALSTPSGTVKQRQPDGRLAASGVADFRAMDQQSRIGIIAPDATVTTDTTSTFDRVYRGVSYVPHASLMGKLYVCFSPGNSRDVVCTAPGLAYALAGRWIYDAHKDLLEKKFNRESSIDSGRWLGFKRNFKKGETVSVSRGAILVFDSPEEAPVVLQQQKRAMFKPVNGDATIGTVNTEELVWTDAPFKFSSVSHRYNFTPHKTLMGKQFVRSSVHGMGKVICTQSGVAYALTAKSPIASQSRYLLSKGFEPVTALDTGYFVVFKRDFTLGESFSIPGKWAFLVF